MSRLLCRLALLAAFAATRAAGAQDGVPRAASGQSTQAASAQTAFADGDLDAALRLVRLGLRADAGDASLLELRLRLLQQGVGYARIDVLPQLRRARRADAARAILDVEPANAVAHGELGEQALRVAAAGLDLVKPTSPRVSLAEVMTDDAVAFEQTGVPARAVRARFFNSRFDLDALADLLPLLDASGPAQRALADAQHHLGAALATADSALADGVADALARTYVLAGNWPGLARLAASRPDADLAAGLAAFRQGDLDAADAAFARGLRNAAPEAAARYADLSPLLTPDQAAAWTADPSGFADAYWLRQDPMLTTPLNERRLEHFARVAEADVRFAGEGGAAGARGSTWVRYGAPRTRRVVSDVAYQDDSRDGLYDVWEYDTHRLVFRDAERGGAYRLYSPPASAFGDIDTAAQAEGDDSVALDEQLRRDAPTQSSLDIPRFDLPALVSVLPGAAGEGAEVIVAYGVPVARAGGGPVPLSLTTGAFLIGPGDATPRAERRRRVDALPESGVVTLPGLTLWAGAEQLPASAGPATVAVEAEASGRVGMARVDVEVPAQTGALALSDIVLAYLVEDADGGPVSRRGVRIVPAPVAAFGRSAPFFVYVEVYGLALAGGQTDYTFEAALVPTDDRSALRRAWDRLAGRAREVGVATASRASGTSATDEQYVALDASGVAPGHYTLVVRVRDAVAGTEVQSEREVRVE